MRVWMGGLKGGRRGCGSRAAVGRSLCGVRRCERSRERTYGREAA